MSQQDIFKKAIAAKLSGDEEGFKAAISEAIKSKAKAMLSEGKQKIHESAEYKGPGVEKVDDEWYFVHQPFNLPEGNIANLPAGQYVASFEVGMPQRVSQYAEIGVQTVEVCHPDDDQVLATLHGQQGEEFYAQYIPQETRDWIDTTAQYQQDDRAERQEFERQEDIGYERNQDRMNNMDGKDYPF